MVALTSAAGGVLESYHPFGRTTINTSAGPDGNWLTPDGDTASSSAVANPYMFTGGRYDEETGLYYYRARHYDPEIGRFLQRPHRLRRRPKPLRLLRQ